MQILTIAGEQHLQQVFSHHAKFGHFLLVIGHIELVDKSHIVVATMIQPIREEVFDSRLHTSENNIRNNRQNR